MSFLSQKYALVWAQYDSISHEVYVLTSQLCCNMFDLSQLPCPLRLPTLTPGYLDQFQPQTFSPLQHLVDYFPTYWKKKKNPTKIHIYFRSSQTCQLHSSLQSLASGSSLSPCCSSEHTEWQGDYCSIPYLASSNS